MIPLRAEYQLGPHALDMLGKIDGPAVPEKRHRYPTRVRTVLVPADLPLVYDGSGWRFGEAPPQWWIEATEPEIADVAEIVTAAPMVIEVRPTSCRPGHGPCRRRHDHASMRRAA